jgi:transcriptional regulator GlxA family with amidase domain
MSRRIALLIYPGFQLLDVAGPLAAFEIAEYYRPGSYAVQVVARDPGSVASSCGVSLHAQRWGRTNGIDTLVVSGGNGSRAATQCTAARRFILGCARSARRVASVCSGTYVLAAAGILDGKSATTHWSRSADFASRFPKVRLEPDRIYIKDGKIWSSAGITAGIDLALALIAEDLGERVARQTAQQLVVYYRRPGGQSQFSALLEMEHTQGRFAAVLDHARASLHKDLSVADLARFSCMSPRHFYRQFKGEIGLSPAKAVERLRVETARAALESGEQSRQRIARSCGFGSTERMRRAFLRVLGVSPLTLRGRHPAAGAPKRRRTA